MFVTFEELVKKQKNQIFDLRSSSRALNRVMQIGVATRCAGARPAQAGSHPAGLDGSVRLLMAVLLLASQLNRDPAGGQGSEHAPALRASGRLRRRGLLDVLHGEENQRNERERAPLSKRALVAVIGCGGTRRRTHAKLAAAPHPPRGARRPSTRACTAGSAPRASCPRRLGCAKPGGLCGRLRGGVLWGRDEDATPARTACCPRCASLPQGDAGAGGAHLLPERQRHLQPRRGPFLMGRWQPLHQSGAQHPSERQRPVRPRHQQQPCLPERHGRAVHCERPASHPQCCCAVLASALLHAHPKSCAPVCARARALPQLYNGPRSIMAAYQVRLRGE